MAYVGEVREKKEEEGGGVAAEGLLNFSFQVRRIDERVVGGFFPARSHPRQFWRRVLVVALISLKEPGERRVVGTSKNLQQGLEIYVEGGELVGRLCLRFFVLRRFCTCLSLCLFPPRLSTSIFFNLIPRRKNCSNRKLERTHGGKGTEAAALKGWGKEKCHYVSKAGVDLR